MNTLSVLLILVLLNLSQQKPFPKEEKETPLLHSMESLVGKFQFENAENIDEYLKGLGVGLVFRKVQAVAKPTIEISFDKSTDQYTFKIESVFRTRTFTFKLDQEFQDESFDARKCTTTASWDGESKLSMFQTCEEGPSVKVVHELTENGLKTVMESGQYKATQIFKRTPVPVPSQ